MSSEVAEVVNVICKVAKDSGVRLHDALVGRLAEAIVASRSEQEMESVEVETEAAIVAEVLPDVEEML